LRILVIGAGGRVGRAILPELQAGHEVLAFDACPLPDVPGAVAGDVLDLGSVASAAEGADAIVHLAIAGRKPGETEEHFHDREFDVNVKGTYHALEAARLKSVPRFVYASSLTVVMGYPEEVFVEAEMPARPWDWDIYGTTKYLGEVLCEHYARHHGLSVVCLRLGTPIVARAPDSRFNPTFVSYRDVAHAFRLAVEAPQMGFEVFHIVGDSSRRRWDLSRARERLGFRPQDVLELDEERNPVT
jgi:uronate dehydrogenase